LDLQYLKSVSPILSTDKWVWRLIKFIVPLRMPRKQKIALLSVLSLSVLVIIAAIVRMVLVSQSESSDDPTCITSLPNPERSSTDEV
jgi:hypothetical protein